MYVWSLSRMGWYMVVLTCGWNGVLSGVLAACVVVCVRCPCGGLQVGILSCRCPACGFTCAWVCAVV